VALTVRDQAAVAEVAVATGGVLASYTYGAVLPAATDPGDLATRATLRDCGQLRLVWHASTEASFTDACAAAASAAAARDAAAAGQTPGPQTLCPAGDLPIVGDYLV
jgi:hypothetical protein